MKIIDVAEFYAEQGGGVRTYVNHKLAAAAEQGHEALVIAPGPETRREERFGGTIAWIASRPMPLDPRYFLLLDERAVHDILDREQPDVVEGSSPWTGGWMAARWKGNALKSFIFHQDPVAVYPQTLLGRRLGYARTDRLFGFYFAYLRRLSAHFDLTVTSGEWLAERLRTFGIDNAKAVPFGVDRALFSSAQSDPQLRAEWLRKCGVVGEADLLVTVSRHHPEKRLLGLMDAFQRASQQRPMGLVIFGDGPLRRWVERKADRTAGVHVAGLADSRDLLARTLASADAMVHGSAAETYGIVLAEGLCAGLPLVVPNRGGAPELATDACAEFYEPGDAQSACDAILRLLARDRTALRTAARRQASEHILDDTAHFTTLLKTYADRLAARRT